MGRVTLIRPGIVRLSALVWLLGAAPLAAQRSEEGRERWQRVPDVFTALGIRPGAQVADVGAGGGFFTVRLARAVGDSGRVYAVDVDSSVIRRLRERVARERLENVEVVHSTERDPQLPTGVLDGVLVVNAYHEFTQSEAMVAGFVRALRPGGRLVIVEQIPLARRLREGRPAQERAHELGSWFAVRDLLLAGFRIVRLEDPFILDGDTEGREDWWMLTAERGEGPSP
jgi:predicted methyltransferase